MSFIGRLQNAWNVFRSNESDKNEYKSFSGVSYSYRPDRPRFTRGNERTIITSILNRIANDTATIDIKHVRLDDNGRYKEEIDSGLNDCLNLEANIDQTGRAFRLDAIMSLLDEGCVALVPVDTTTNPKLSNSYDIKTIRTGKIIQWFPSSIKVSVYNESIGKREEIIIPKSYAAIVENPFFSIMNEPNSTMQRLIRKLTLLDAIDELNGSGKLDLIIQLPYVVKSETRQKQAEQRRTDIEEQLTGSKYGIAYIDGTEHITQLNRPVENNLMSQIEYLQNLLYSQLGITQSIMDGTADEKVMLNYNNRVIEPILSAFVDEMKRKFLTKTARTQGQSIMYFRDPFKLVPVDNIAEIADKFTRNEIMSSNEVRQIVGMKPSSDPKADELRNKNLNEQKPLSNSSNDIENQQNNKTLTELNEELRQTDVN